MKKILIINLLLFFLHFSLSKAEIINALDVDGNKRISKASIIDIVEFEKGKDYNLDDLNKIQKKLLETNFFSEVKVNVIKNNIKILLTENPLIDFFYIRGIKNKERENLIYKLIQLGPNKIYTDFKLKKDIEIIRDIYVKSGYFDVNIYPRISKLEGNVVNVVLDIDRKEKSKIKRVFFIGNKFFSSSTLLDVISSGESGWWKFLSSSSIVNTDRIKYDTGLLKKFYLDNGFYDVQITNSDIEFLNDGFVNVIFSINSGNRYNFSNISIKDESNQLKQNDLENIKLIANKKIKDYFSVQKINYTKEKIFTYFEKNKISFVDLLIDYNKNKNNNIDVNFKIYGTKKKYVNLINVKGNNLTDEDVVRRNLEFAEGDTLENYKLNESIDNLKAIGVFKNVKAKQILINNSELVNIEIDVEEQPTGSISAGIGAGSSGASVSGGLNEKNLLGKGISLGSNVSLGTEKIEGSIVLNIPDFKNTGNSLGAKIYSISNDYTNAGYQNKKIGNSYFTKYELFDDIYLTTGLGLEFDKIDTNNSASALYKKREGDYITYNGFYDVVKDERNSKFLPTSGHLIGFGQNLGLPGSDIPFLSNSFYGSSYYSYKKNYIMNFKGGLDTINSLSNKDVKLSDRKFLTNKKLRGFESYGVGPKDGKDHVGGNYSAYASISSTFPNPLPEKWNAKSILFLDTGNVWGVDYDSSLDKDKIRSSTGISLEWISPLGPLSFTLSETISSAEGDLEESFNFQIGSTF